MHIVTTKPDFHSNFFPGLGFYPKDPSRRDCDISLDKVATEINREFARVSDRRTDREKDKLLHGTRSRRENWARANILNIEFEWGCSRTHSILVISQETAQTIRTLWSIRLIGLRPFVRLKNVHLFYFGILREK